MSTSHHRQLGLQQECNMSYMYSYSTTCCKNFMEVKAIGVPAPVMSGCLLIKHCITGVG